MSGAPYGYRYVRKTDDALASYAAIETEARVVQRIYDLYPVEGLSIGAIARRLNEDQVRARRRTTSRRSARAPVDRAPRRQGGSDRGDTIVIREPV